MSSSTLTRNKVRGASAVLHGVHPLRGYPVTWHLTPLAYRTGGLADFLVERADGHIEDSLVWDLAEKDTVIMTAHEMCELVRRSSGRPA
ncbi:MULTISPECIES: hypothetical protein [unclassified Actinotalea]|uniref:hypothetical protein n=1 Tax=unclassified Actinotalea TaxID=2638618 RepID=UPI0015F6AD78|nr:MULTISPECIES: hypothetical protein [unclassified Actinotalea]